MPRILIGVTGSVATIKLTELTKTIHDLIAEAEIRIVLTHHALHFTPGIDESILAYTDEDEWALWKQRGDPVLHIELAKWAEYLLIAPLDANTLAKIAGGLCDNMLTCVLRAWPQARRNNVLLAPAMNTVMWDSPITSRQIALIKELFCYHFVDPISKQLVCGDTGMGAMAEPKTIAKELAKLICINKS